jgi:predicted amidohydrolase
MARKITISALGPRPITGEPSRPHQQAIDEMIQHWRAQMDLVLPDRPDLIVVPEACDRYPNYTMEQRLDYYRARGNQVRDAFAAVARDHHCYIAYSAARQMPDGTWRNSTQILDRSGSLSGVYNKNHLVIEETTKAGILCGREARVIHADFGSLACAICFDLNFDELRDRYKAQRPDLVVFCSMYHGGLMQNYWAYDCRAHFVGAVAGAECTVINPLGERLAHSTNYYPWLTTQVNLDCALAHIDYNNARFRALKQRYGRGVTISDPGYLGCVLLTNEMPGTTVLDLVTEFEIELLDDYWARALAHRRDHTEP